MVQNKSYSFILPMILGKRELAYIKGCYIRCSDYPQYDDKIFLVLENTGSEACKKDLEFLTYNTEYLFQYDVDDKTIVMVFTVPVVFALDYRYFIEGRYSKFSDMYKKTIVQFHRITKQDNIYYVLKKDPAYKKELEVKLDVKIPDDQDLMSKPDMDEETFVNVDTINIDSIMDKESKDF